jgi:hypothetical protein
MTQEQRLTMQANALQRAQTGTSIQNEMIVLMEFQSRGIPANQMHPRENCLTFHAWKAKGRSVMKGEHGVKVDTYFPRIETDLSTGQERECLVRRTAVIFHESQTRAL